MKVPAPGVPSLAAAIVALLVAAHPAPVRAQQTGPAMPAARVTVGPGTAAGTEARISLAEPRAPLAAYQGEVCFDAAAVHFVSAAFPAGVTGAANEATPGCVRFAAAAPDGAPSGAILVLLLRSDLPLTSAALHVVLREARSLR